MKQREIWVADLNPTRGSEQKGIRSVVVISGNAMNDNLNIAIVCPISSKVKGYAGCLLVKSTPENGLPLDSEVITFQVRTISKERLISKLGTITNEQLAKIKQGLSEIMTY